MSFKGGRRKAHASSWSQNGCKEVGHWSPRKKMGTVLKPPFYTGLRSCHLWWPKPRKFCFCVTATARPLCLPWTTKTVVVAQHVAQRRQNGDRPIAMVAQGLPWSPVSDHLGDHCASIRPPPQHLGHHGNGFASTLPPLSDLLCHYSSFGGSKRHTGRAAAVTQQQNFLGFWPFYWTLIGGTKIAALCKGALMRVLRACQFSVLHVKYVNFAFFQTIKFPTIHVYPHFHMYAIIGSVVKTGLVMHRNIYQTYFPWSALHCLFHWLRSAGHILEQRWHRVTWPR